MFCFCRESEYEEFYPLHQPQPFSLPCHIPHWPQGQGFGTGRINLGEIEVLEVTKFESICSSLVHKKEKGVTFYRPVGIPDGFYSFGDYCQLNDQPLRGYVLVARDLAADRQEDRSVDKSALIKPQSYILLWSSDSEHEQVFIWQPRAPKGYKSLGFVVTTDPREPELEEVRCVRADLTEDCEVCDLMLDTLSTLSNYPIKIWNTRSCIRGMLGTCVSVGTFFCSTYLDSGDDMKIVFSENW